MKTNSQRFDMVHDCQRLFRLILHAMANPGVWVDYSELTEKFERDCLLMPLLLTLCDTEAGYWLKDCSADLIQEVSMLCGARETSLTNAEFIFTSEDIEPIDILHQARPGSFTDPHESATIIIIISEGTETEEHAISGPGIPPGGRVIKLTSSVLNWLRERREMQYEYPLGVDLLLVHPGGRLLGLPRTTKG